MCYKLCLIALSVLACGLHSVHSAAVDPSQLVVEQQPPSQVAEAVDAVVAADESSVPEQCHQPKETGRCFALFYRYAYNVDTHTCEEFVYGGCSGNSNNFETKEHCEQLCLGKSAPATAATGTELSLELTTEPELMAATTESSTQSGTD